MRWVNFFIAIGMLSFASAPAIAEYSGAGGMAAYSISAEVYEYHYEHGFTGVDAMGWDPNLQYAWSRTGAALSCGIDINKDAVLSHMSEKFGSDPFIHDMNGVSFHHMQSKKIDGFCSQERVSELKAVMPRLESGDFPQLFD